MFLVSLDEVSLTNPLQFGKITPVKRCPDGDVAGLGGGVIRINEIPLCCRIASLVENGLIQRWREIYYPKNKCVSHQRTRTQDPANAEQFQGALAMLCAGVVAATLTLLGEVYLRTVRRLRRLQRNWTV